MTVLLRILRTAGQNIFRHGLVNITAVLVITLIFLLLNGLLFTNFIQAGALKIINERLDLALTFESPPDTFQLNTLKGELKKEFPEIRKTTFISSKEAFTRFLSNFRAENRNLSDWLEKNLNRSPLPATFVISADASLHDPIIGFLTAGRFAKLLDLEAVASGALATTAATKIIKLDRILRDISLLAILCFIALSVLIIVAVLRLAIVSRAKEITIMRLVGATRQFIRLPFIIEGVFFSSVASLLGAVVFLTLLSRIDFAIFANGLTSGVTELLEVAAGDYAQNFALLLGWQILAAVLVGICASYLATWKHLRRKINLE